MILKKQLSCDFSKQLFNDFANNLSVRMAKEFFQNKEAEDPEFSREEYMDDFINEWVKGSSENVREQINMLGLEGMPVHIEDVASQTSKSIREISEFAREIFGVTKNK